VLSDAQKRDVYDRFGEEGLSGGASGMGGMSPEDLFANIFGSSFFGGGSSQRSGPRKGKDVNYPLKVELDDLYNGKVSKLALNKQVICTGCAGIGGKEGSVKKCAGCQGTGVKVIIRQLGPMVQQMQQPCNECRGEGEIIDEKHRCKQCKGKKVVSEKKILEVYVEKGMKNGQRITFDGEGDQMPGIIPGDVNIILEEKPNSKFTRKNDDLIYKAEIDLITALSGGTFSINHMDQRILLVNIIPGEVIKPGETKVIVGEGMPIYKRSDQNGNLFIEFEIKFPSHNWTTPENMTLLEKILPKRRESVSTKGKIVDEYVLQAVDAGMKAGASNGSSDRYMDEDHHDDHHQGANVQCAQQ
jgi:DnaJ-class molecular chaperone